MRAGARRLSALALLAVTACVALAGLAGCAAGDGDGKVTLRLGYFPNLTHASAIAGVQNGIFAERLGPGVALQAKTFNAGPEAVEALFAKAIDATFIGPNPAINAHAKSRGQAIRIISGATSGGAALVVQPQITAPDQLRGKKLATPQLGNTQDVALRYWLKQHGMATTKEGGGAVKILPQDNGRTVETFAGGAIDGAWVPEPFVARLVAAGGKVLVDERDLWPDRRFVTTHLVVRTEFLERHRDVVRRLVAGQVAATEFVTGNAGPAQQAISTWIGKLTGKPLDLQLIARAWPSLEFTTDPVASSLAEGAKHAEEVGLLEKFDPAGLYDLTLLNEVLRGQGKPEVV